MLTRRTLFGATLATSALSLVGCSKGSSSKGGGGDGKTITLFHRWPTEPKNGYFETLVKAFQDANPGVTVKVEKVLNDTYKDKVRVSVGSAQSPDVYFSWSGSFASSLVATGNVMELDDLLSKNSAFKDQFYPSQMAPMQVDGKQVGLPIGMIGKFFFYNKKLMDQHSLAVPTTWEELLDLCEEARKAGLLPISYGAKDQWTIAHWVGTLNQRVLEPDVTKKDYDPKTGEFTDAGYVKALELFKQLFPYMTPNANAVAHQDARDAFIAGKSLLMYLEGAEYNYFTKDFEWGTFNFPSVPDGKGDPKQLTGAPEGFMLAKNSKNAELADKFLEFMLSPEWGTKWTDMTGELSAIKGAVDASSAPEGVKQMAKQIGESTAMTPWLDNAIDQRLVATYLSATQLLIGGKASAEDVMKKVQDTAKQVRG